MMFQRKLDRAMRWSRKRRMKEDGKEIPEEIDGEEELPTDEELRAEGQNIELEKGDMRAMLIAGLITILPVCVIVLLLLGLLCILFAGGF